MNFLYLKSLHIIFVITWFAGLFYIVRLFIYHVEAEDLDKQTKMILQKQYKIMSKRLWFIITWPSSILASFFAFTMLYMHPQYLKMDWMLVKLSFVFLLYIYHFICHRIFNQLQQNIIKHSAIKLRIWNEVATILVFAIVFIVVLKSATNWIYGVVGLVSLSVILMIAIKWYKRLRENNV